MFNFVGINIIKVNVLFIVYFDWYPTAIYKSLYLQQKLVFIYSTKHLINLPKNINNTKFDWSIK